MLQLCVCNSNQGLANGLAFLFELLLVSTVGSMPGPLRL